MFRGPLDHQAERAGRQRAMRDGKIADLDHCLMLAIPHMKVWRPVFIESNIPTPAGNAQNPRSMVARASRLRPA